MSNFNDLKATLNNGKEVNFGDFKGKKVLLVNTASECGYTPQYEELEKLYEQYKDTVVVLGFPSNEFGGQEPGSDEEIAQFCKINYGVTFPIFSKSVVKKSEGQNPVFAWLTTTAENGWNEQQPEWNFNKYLVSEEGELEAYYPSGISPLGDEITSAVNS
jgi:glutathione peroxidase